MDEPRKDHWLANGPDTIRFVFGCIWRPTTSGRSFAIGGQADSAAPASINRTSVPLSCGEPAVGERAVCWQIVFDNVRVPKRNHIGEEGKGFTYQMVQFQEERLWAPAACLKALEFIIDETIEYTRNRKAFGQSILDNQVVHFKLAEMQTEVRLLRSLTYRAAEALIAGEDVTRLATMAKLKAGRLARELTDACLQYRGSMGFMNENARQPRLSRYPLDFDRRRGR